MAWSRGVPPLLCFDVGHIFYARVLPWLVQVKDAKPDTKPGSGGWVKFVLHHYDAGKVVGTGKPAGTEQYTLSQADFESFLRTGQLPFEAKALSELDAEPAV
jgi:hypothetical protein